MSDRIALRGSEESLLICILTSTGIEVTDQLPSPGMTATSWAPGGRELAVLDLSGKRIQLFEMGPDGPLRRPSPPTLPKGSTGTSLLSTSQGVFVGGGSLSSGDSLWRLVGNDFQPIPMPEGTGGRGKCVDHLFVVDDLLVAVDDMIFPKWTVTFRLDADGSVRSEAVHPLVVHGPRSQVRRGATGARLVALYSTSVGRAGCSAYVSLMDKRELDEIGYVRASFGWGEFGPVRPLLAPRLRREVQPDPEAERLEQLNRDALDQSPTMSFVGDLLVLGGLHGLFILDMEGVDLGVPSRKAALAQALGVLNERAQEVVRLRHLGPDGPMTLSEIGERLGLSRERVRQIEMKAVQRLRIQRERSDGVIVNAPSRGLSLPPIRQVTTRPVLDVAGVAGLGCAVTWAEGTTEPEWLPLERLRGAPSTS